MKTRNDCEIACDCVKRANVVLHVGLCKEIFARKHTATHKPTSAQHLSAPHSDQRDIHSPVEPLGLRPRGNKIASRYGAPRPPMTDKGCCVPPILAVHNTPLTDVGTETAFRLDQRKHSEKVNFS